MVQLFGRYRGGLAMSNVASAVFMSGISGSAVADTSALGRVLIPAMVKEGYGPGFAAPPTALPRVPVGWSTGTAASRPICASR